MIHSRPLNFHFGTFDDEGSECPSSEFFKRDTNVEAFLAIKGWLAIKYGNINQNACTGRALNKNSEQ